MSCSKFILMLIISLLLITTLLYSKEPVVIRIIGDVDRAWNADKGVDWEGEIPLFEAKHPNIKVELIHIYNPDELYLRLKTILSGKDYRYKKSDIDVIEISDSWIAEFAHHKWLHKLDKFFYAKSNKQDAQDFIQACLQYVSYKNKLYALPKSLGTTLLYSRRDFLETDSPPATWDELYEKAKEFQNEYVAMGFTFYTAAGPNLAGSFANFLMGKGIFLTNNDGTFNEKALTLPETIETLEYIKEFSSYFQGGYRDFNNDVINSQYRNGRAAFLMEFNYVWNLLKYAESWGLPVTRDMTLVSPIPRFSEDQPEFFPVGCSGVAISRHSKHKKEAWELVKFLTSKQMQDKRISHRSILPTRKSVYDKSHKPGEITELNFVNMLLDDNKEIKTPSPRFIHPKSRYIAELIAEYVLYVLEGDLKAEEALTELAEKIKKIVK